MRFEQRSPLIIFHDNAPGEHATLFGPNGLKLPFRGEESAFNNALRTFAWAFEGTVIDGDSIVFATTDREVVGKVHGLDIEVEIPERGSVLRDEENRPFGIAGDLLPPMEVLLDAPHQRSRPRPIPMPKPRP